MGKNYLLLIMFLISPSLTFGSKVDDVNFVDSLYNKYKGSPKFVIDSLLQTFNPAVENKRCVECESKKHLLGAKLYYSLERVVLVEKELEKVVINNIREETLQADYYFLKGRIAFFRTPDLVARYLELANSLASTSGNNDVKYESLMYLSKNEIKNSNYVEALKHYEEAYLLSVHINDSNKIFKSLIQKNSLLDKVEEYVKMEELNRELLNDFGADSAKLRLINFYLAYSLSKTGKCLEAIEAQLNLVLSSHNKEVIYHTSILNLIHYIIECNEKMSLNEIYSNSNNLLLDKVFPDWKKIKSSDGEVYKVFENKILETKLFFDTINVQSYLFYPYHSLGVLFLKQHRYKEAESYLLVAVELSKEEESRLKMVIYHDLISVYDSLKMYEKAFIWQKKMNRMNDSLKLDRDNFKIGQAVATTELKHQSLINDLKKKEEEAVTNLENAKRKANQKVIIGFVVMFVIFIGIWGVFYFRKKKFESENKLLYLEQKLLRTQMNPHFIFNSLTTIGSYIISNRVNESYNYISQFSKLIRLILESSREEVITLEEEILIVNNFLSLHQMNKKERLNYSLNYDKTILDKEIVLPPMLLQPFIENAVKYGEDKISKTCLVEVEFRLLEKELYCSVRDFGDGFDVKREKEETSYSIQITKERIESIKKQLGKDIKLNIIDFTQYVPREKGVLVEIFVQV